MSAGSSTNGGTAEFLSELNETESLAALQAAHREQAPFIFRLESEPQPQKVQIANFLDKRAILDAEAGKIKLPEGQDISFKFNVGTEVFFVKTPVKSHLNRYYFDMGSRVIQLKRRKEPRYFLPKKWTHTAHLVINQQKSQFLKCLVHDISLSGIRLEVLEGIVDYKRDDLIQIKFQIYKRAEVQTPAIVRFVLKRPNLNVLLGLELTQISDVNRQRVAHIVEDIHLYNATNK